MARELFIYWRLEPSDLPAAVQALQAWQAGLANEWPGLMARLYRRADDSASGHATLMETYAREGGIPPGLQADVVASGLQQVARWCRGPRQVEIFEPIDP